MMKLSGQTALVVDAIKKQQQTLREKLELVVLRDLVEKLDPKHDYTFDAQNMEFTKTPKEEPKAPLGLQ